MNKLIEAVMNSDDNCYGGDFYDPSHTTDEIYTCLDCLEAGIRAAERERIIKLLEPHRPTSKSVGGFLAVCSCGEAIDDYQEHLIALIKGENK